MNVKAQLPCLLHFRRSDAVVVVRDHLASALARSVSISARSSLPLLLLVPAASANAPSPPRPAAQTSSSPFCTPFCSRRASDDGAPRASRT